MPPYALAVINVGDDGKVANRHSPPILGSPTGAPACGDVMKLQIKCEPKGNTHIIKDVKFKTYGCGSAIASASELVDMLIGKTLEEAKAIKNVEIVEALELPPIKIHCSVLAEDSIRQAIEDYESKQ